MFIINSFWIGLGSHPGMRSERVATNRLRMLSIGGMIFDRKKKPKYFEKNLFHGHFIHHKLHIGKSGIETGITLWEARRTKRANIKLIFTVCFSASSQNYVYIYIYNI